MLKKIVTIASILVVFTALCVGNVLCFQYKDIISTYFYGYSVDNSEVEFSKFDDFCKEVEQEGLVLLKNDNNVLPLSSTNVNVFGWSATDGGFVHKGNGSGATKNTDSEVSFLESLKDNGFCYNESIIQTYESYCSKRETSSYFSIIEPDVSLISPLIDNAKAFSDTAIVVISRSGREQYDLPREQAIYGGSTDYSKTYLQLSTNEENLINLVSNNFEKVVVLLNTCNTMEVGFLQDDKIDSAMYVGAPGQSGTDSIVKALKGEKEYTPSGKLSDIYAYDLSTAPSYINSANGSAVDSSKGGVHSYSGANDDYYVDYAEGIYVGYRWYETADAEGYFDSIDNEYGVGYDGIVQYPFGYGLSYTDFDWTVKKVEPADGSIIDENTEIKVTVNVKNIGQSYGKEVVQLYYESEYNQFGIEKASKNLAAFEKTKLLAPKESVDVVLSFKASDMKSYDYENNGCYIMEDVDYYIYVQTDSHHVIDDENANTTYSLNDEIIIDKDEATNYEISNRFTGNDAEYGISIDGSTTSQNITYLSRGDFAATFPQLTDRRVKTFEANTGWSTAYDTTETYQYGVDSNLRLYTSDEDGNLVMNEELIKELGENYDSEKWETLISQMSTDEMWELIGLGGYGTVAIDSIGKPKFIDWDGPGGLNDSNMTKKNIQTTYYPIETIIACSFNKELAFKYGQYIGLEANELKDITGWYAPATNIHRSPFDGRNYEYYSEDPYLSGIMAAQTIDGAKSEGIICYVKHFALNETENHRKGLYTWLTEQTLREIYLKPFEIAVKNGGANAVMSSYNRIGATWTGGSYALCTEILRNEWGFKGTVITDYCDDPSQSLDQGIRAGNDLYLKGNIIVGSDRTSATALSCARRCVKNILYSYCNSVAYSENYLSKSASSIASTWIIFLFTIDALALASFGVLLYFQFFKKEKKKDN